MADLLLNRSRRLWFTLRFIYDLLPNLLPNLFILGAALTILVYTPIPPKFCGAPQLNAFAPNKAGCDAILALYYRFSHPLLTTQSMSGNIANFVNLSYASRTSGLPLLTIRTPEQTPILIDDAVRRITQVLFTLSIVWPRLLEPGKVLGGSLNVDRRGNT